MMKRRFTNGKIKSHNHILKGMMTCSHCGCLVSWEIQKGNTYGRCKGFKKCVRKGLCGLGFSFLALANG